MHPYFLADTYGRAWGTAVLLLVIFFDFLRFPILPLTLETHMNRPLKPIRSLTTALVLFAGTASAQMPDDKTDHDRMDMPASADMRTSQMFEGVGNVVAIDLENRKIGLDHGPVPALQWPAMKMGFKVLDSVDLSSIEPGDRVQFTLHKVENGPYPIAEICLTRDTEISPGLCAAEPRAGHAAH